MLSFQEIQNKTEGSRKTIQECLDKGVWHPSDANIYEGLKAADAFEVKETLDNMTLAEVLMKGHTGQGTANIVATKVHDVLYYMANDNDICPRIGQMLTYWEGGPLTVNIGKDGTFKPIRFTSGGKLPDQEVQFATAGLTADKLEPYGMNMTIGRDLIDDNQYGLVEWHVKQAGSAIGKLASELALTVLKAGADGDGSLNSLAAGAGVTTYASVLEAVDENGRDQFISDTMVVTPEAWEHSIGQTATGLPGITAKPIEEGYDMTLQQLNVLLRADPVLHASTDVPGAAFLACVTIVFDRDNSMLTGRKRWLELKNYSDPVNDLANAVISFRQDSVTLYKDSICVLTET